MRERKKKHHSTKSVALMPTILVDKNSQISWGEGGGTILYHYHLYHSCILINRKTHF